MFRAEQIQPAIRFPHLANESGQESRCSVHFKIAVMGVIGWDIGFLLPFLVFRAELLLVRPQPFYRVGQDEIGPLEAPPFQHRLGCFRL